MKWLFSILIFTLSFAFGTNDYPYLTKPVPKPEKEEIPLTPKLKERDFNEKMDAYIRCKKQDKTIKECNDLLGPQYDLSFEYKPQ